jgi:hypothetical protein
VLLNLPGEPHLDEWFDGVMRAETGDLGWGKTHRIRVSVEYLGPGQDEDTH